MSTENVPTVVVFRPLLEVRWPEHCVGCFGQAPSARLSLSTYKATAAATATRVGGLVGGFVGALAGAAVGAVAGAGETSRYSIPICGGCQALLEAQQVKALADSLSERVDTPLFTVSLRDKCVCMAFHNAEYAAAFREANAGLAFDTVTACQAAQKAAKQAAKTPAPAELTPELRELAHDPGVPWDEVVRRIVAEAGSQRGLHVGPELAALPADKLATATSSCELPAGEAVVALIDTGGHRSLRDCLLFGKEAVYFHNDKYGNTPGAGHIPYRAFPDRIFQRAGFFEIDLGLGKFVNAAGCSTPKPVIVQILMSIRQAVIEREHPGRAEAEVAPAEATEGPAPAAISVPVAADTPIPDLVLAVLQGMPAQDGLFLEPNVPPKRLANALKVCELPPTERVLALIDCTVLGSANCCLLFGEDGIHYRNNWTGKTPGTGTVPYSEFPERFFDQEGRYEVALGRNQFVNVSGSYVPQTMVIDILQSVRAAVIARQRHAGPGGPPSE